MTFRDKIAIVAGGAQGIGGGVTRALAAEGARVTVWDIDEDAMAATVKDVEASGGNIEAVRLDAFDYGQVEAGVQAVVDREGRLDFMVSTVGGGTFVSFIESTAEFFEAEIRRNLFSAYNCARAALPPMLEQDSGRMIFFTSTTGGMPGLVGYGAAKAGIESMIKTMVAELADTKITVNAIRPGVTDTPLLAKEFAALPNGDELMAQAAARPLGINTPENIAQLALFLLGDDGLRITGQVLASL